MIKSFKNTAAEKVFNRIFIKKFSGLDVPARKKLLMIDAAINLNDLRVPPSNHLEALKGALKGKHSIRINDQFRVVFKWKDNDAYEVEITDYH